VCRVLHSYKKTAIIYCHICGNILPIVELLVETGLDCIGPLDPLGGFTSRQVREKAGNNISLMGGVNTLTLRYGTSQEVKDEAVKCMEGAGDEGGFILGSGCVVPRDTSEQNIIALVEASKQFKRNNI
jgi:uroporphyrinogen-III decarboxylase